MAIVFFPKPNQILITTRMRPPVATTPTAHCPTVSVALTERSFLEISMLIKYRRWSSSRLTTQSMGRTGICTKTNSSFPSGNLTFYSFLSLTFVRNRFTFAVRIQTVAPSTQHSTSATSIIIINTCRNCGTVGTRFPPTRSRKFFYRLEM